VQAGRCEACRQAAVQAVDVPVNYTSFAGTLAGETETSWAVGIRPVVTGKSKKLVLEWSNSSDGRRIQLGIRGRHILKALRLNTR